MANREYVCDEYWDQMDMKWTGDRPTPATNPQEMRDSSMTKYGERDWGEIIEESQHRFKFNEEETEKLFFYELGAYQCQECGFMIYIYDINNQDELDSLLQPDAFQCPYKALWIYSII